jgi:N-acetylglucosamine-6-phosphate deacetylase
MNSFLILNTAILEPGKKIQVGDLLVRNGRIAGFGDLGAVGTDGPRFDGRGRLLTPGLVDVHTHGILRFKYENGADDLRNAVASLARFGVTTVLPTIVPPILTEPGAKAAWLRHLAATAAALAGVTGIHVPGLHLEGPFLAITGATAATMDGDLGLLDEILQAAGGRIAAMSVSPETCGILPVISELRRRNIRVFLTHTRASVDQTLAALDAGARHATHFYDVFYSPPETDLGVRPVGIVETILADPRATVDFIADGVHVHPMAIRAAVAAKTWAGVTLITDSNIGAGLPPGVYDTPWGYAVRVSPETGARHAIKHTLSGSALTMNRGMQNLLRWLALPPEQIWAMGTLNPCRLLELPGRGVIECGAVADLVLWEEDLMPAMTWSEGNCVYRGAREPERPS